MSEKPRRVCNTCRYWDVHSLDALKGDCKAPDNHRYWRGKLAVGGTYLMDSFEGVVTSPRFSCQAHKFGEDSTP